MSDTAPSSPKSLYNKNNPFPARITENRLLTQPGSEKETRHFVLNIEGSGLEYQPGYSLGVTPVNPPTLAAELIETLRLDPTHPIAQKDGSTRTLIDVLTRDFTLNRLGTKFVKAVAEKLPPGPRKDDLAGIAADPEKLNAFVFTRDYIDFLREYPETRVFAEELPELLGRIVPRLYSIASSPARHPGEVHLTVAVVRYHTHNRDKKGLASGYLADHTEIGTANIPVFLAPNKHFKLPDNPDADIIMVGPGTGIAPFRAFLEQREIDGAKGRNWLFFGDQRHACDFLYREELEAWRDGGLLTRLDTAFSRDQSRKIYVQDRMRENAAELWNWIQNGAHFFVCGDAKRMAKDVHQTLIDIAVEQGGLSVEQADDYVNKTLMREERRYVRDVY